MVVGTGAVGVNNTKTKSLQLVNAIDHIFYMNAYTSVQRYWCSATRAPHPITSPHLHDGRGLD